MLRALTEFVNNTDLGTRRLAQIERKFVSNDNFNLFKEQMDFEDERGTSIVELQKVQRQMQQKMIEVDGGVANLEHDFGQLKSKVGYKADLEEVGRIEERLLDFVTRDQYGIVL